MLSQKLKHVDGIASSWQREDKRNCTCMAITARVHLPGADDRCASRVHTAMSRMHLMMIAWTTNAMDAIAWTTNASDDGWRGGVCGRGQQTNITWSRRGASNISNVTIHELAKPGWREGVCWMSRERGTPKQDSIWKVREHGGEPAVGGSFVRFRGHGHHPITTVEDTGTAP